MPRFSCSVAYDILKEIKLKDFSTLNNNSLYVATVFKAALQTTSYTHAM